MSVNDASRVDDVLHRLLASSNGIPTRLTEAMRYAVLGGGKRIRARLVYAAGRLAGASDETLDHAAAAVELIHAYSLVHDDLPAMDDDDLRRGRPTVHVQYDEATAILVGDALHALAFEAASSDVGDPGINRYWVRTLARAAGPEGMVGGQVLDLAGEGKSLSLAEIENVHRHKTGALLHAAVAMGANAGSLSANAVDALKRFGTEIGLAFQVHDDVLDVTADTAVLGKPSGSDARQGKSTYVTALGVDAARAEARRRFDQACAHLAPFGDGAHELIAIARFVVNRDN